MGPGPKKGPGPKWARAHGPGPRAQKGPRAQWARAWAQAGPGRTLARAWAHGLGPFGPGPGTRARSRALNQGRRRRRRKNFPSRPGPTPSRRDHISRSGTTPHSDKRKSTQISNICPEQAPGMIQLPMSSVQLSRQAFSSSHVATS